ncbi:MAG: serine/threonine-protein kinase, partial [Acidobacteriota bacterium]
MIDKMLRHYRIVEKLGEGGMGIVYKAEDTKLRRTAALKFLRPGLTGEADAATRFLQEAQAAAALDHPNICSVYEIGEADGRTYIAMAYVEGKSLKQTIESGPVDIGEALHIAIQIAEGLKEAHARGVIHRDIKPGNIMLTHKGLVKIMDFGLAKTSWGEDITRSATTVGTVAYMSPEQASGLKVDHRTDLWALGCILYEMLSGRRAFMGDHDHAVIHAIMYEEAQPLSMLRESIAGDLEAVLRKCLQKDPQHRYRNSAELLEALRSVSRSQSAPETGRP